MTQDETTRLRAAKHLDDLLRQGRKAARRDQTTYVVYLDTLRRCHVLSTFIPQVHPADLHIIRPTGRGGVTVEQW